MNEELPKGENSQANTKTSKTYRNVISHFLYRLESLEDSAAIVIAAIKSVGEARVAQATNELSELTDGLAELARHAVEKKEARSAPKHENNPVQEVDEAVSQINASVRDLFKFAVAPEIVINSLFVSLFTLYDAFIGDLIRLLGETKPHIISDKSVTYLEISSLTTIHEIKEYVIDKEVESLLRKSYTEQFEDIRKKIDVKTLRDGLTVWPEFIEISQRRNLIVHAAGRVSRQYLNECKEAGYHWPRGEAPNVGDILRVNHDYFLRAVAVVHEVSFKLAQVMYRVTVPGELAVANKLLTDHMYDLLYRGNYSLTIEIGSFALGMPKLPPDATVRMILINLAQAHKWSGNNNKATELIDSKDWSSCSDNFLICVLLIKDKFNAAADVMKRIGNRFDFDEKTYAEWPIFKDFRQTDIFFTTFKELFGVSFIEYSEKAAQKKTLSASKLKEAVVERSEAIIGDVPTPKRLEESASAE